MKHKHFFLIILIIPSLIFLASGCGGGGGSSSAGIYSNTTSIITGSIYVPATFSASLRPQTIRGNAPSGMVPVVGATVFIKSFPGQTVTTDINGFYSLPINTDNNTALQLVSKTKDRLGNEFLNISTPFIPSEKPSVSLNLEEGKKQITGDIRNVDGQAIAFAELSIWGVKFYSDISGKFVSTKFPQSATNGNILITASGYSSRTINIFFNDNLVPPHFDIILKRETEANLPPAIQLIPQSTNVSPGDTIQLALIIQDTDELDLTYFKPTWDTTAGTISKTSTSIRNQSLLSTSIFDTSIFVTGRQVYNSYEDILSSSINPSEKLPSIPILRETISWKAPQESGLATVSVNLKDSRQAYSNAAFSFAVGGSTQTLMRISSMTPIIGSVNTEVTITGSAFSSNQGSGWVSFNGKKATITSWSGSVIKMTVPSQAESGLVVVQSDGQEKTAGYFTVTPAKVSFSPSYGPPGTIINISGLDFGATQGDGKVFLNGTETTINSWTDTAISLPVPDNSKSGQVILKIGQYERSLGFYSVSRAFAISSEKASLGNSVSITGEGFGTSQLTSQLKFANSIDAIISTWSDTQIVLEVPSGAVTGNLTATINGINLILGAIEIISIESLSTDKGTINAPVTITGTGFGNTQGLNSVSFNGFDAAISNWSDTSISCLVPASSTPGPLTVNVNGFKTNSKQFTTSAIYSISHKRGPAGTLIKITGTGFGTNLGFVTFGDVNSTNYTTWGENTIIAAVPETATSAIKVNVGINGVVTNSVDFSISAIVNQSVSEGWVGRVIDFTGQYFGDSQGDSKVLFNGVQAQIVKWTNNAISARVPVGATTGDLHVVISNGIINREEFEIPEVDEYQLTKTFSGSVIDALPSVSYVFVAANGNYLVSDFVNHWIWEYDSNRKFIKRIGRSGYEDAQFKQPWGITQDSTGNIYIADSGNHRIQKFDSSGNFIGWLGRGDDSSTGWHNPGSGLDSEYGSNNSEFKFPTGIFINSSDNLFVADTLNNRIQEFAADGTHIRNYQGAVGDPDGKNGKLKEPYGLFVDSSNNVWVADTINNRIQKYDSSGNPTIWYGQSQNSAEGLIHPSGSGHLAIDNIGIGNGTFDAPRGIYIDANGDIIIGDTGNSKIQILNSLGVFQSDIGDIGGGLGQYDGITNIIKLSDGNLVISDKENYRIQSVTKTGNFLWSLTPDTSGLTAYPTGIAIDTDHNRLYIADRNNHMISQFTLAGVFTKFIGSQGSGKGQFFNPSDVAIDNAGNIFVADAGNARIQKFNLNGDYQSEFGSFGTGNGQFKSITKIAINPTTNELWSVDTTQGRIQKFSSEGDFILKTGSIGPGEAQFTEASAIEVDDKGNVYVTDRLKPRVCKFDSFGNFVGWWGFDDFGYNGWHASGSGRIPQVDDAPGRFDSLDDVCVDAEGNVYVLDIGNYNIQKFRSDQAAEPIQDKNANYVTTLDSSDEFTSFDVDASGNLFITTEIQTIEEYSPDI